MRRMVRGIRFRPEARRWILEGRKSTTFRRTKRKGLYEIVEGSWFKPKGLRIYVVCEPIEFTTAEDVVSNHYATEGPFKSSEEFLAWLKREKLELPEKGWLNKVEKCEPREEG